ncbi:MAG: ATP-binding cassette domain-containing protein [Alphaproteobacteria bacterium TMED93]|nr:MAG: ATP-binding cassette domain-containing protein [Alphaproteobacteria bacterium TMED93]
MLTLNQFLKNNKWQSFWIIISSLLINILALSSAIYVIQVFNKYLTYKLDSTLIVLTVGVTVAFILEFFLRFVRGLLANKASVVGKRELVLKKIKQAFTIKLGVLDSKNEKQLFDNLNPNISYNNSDESDRLISLIDIFFVIIFLFFIYLLSIRLGVISSIFIITYLFFIKLKNKYLVNLTNIKNKKIYKIKDIYSDISNMATAVRTFNSKHILYSLFELNYARQRAAEVKFKNYNNFYNIIFSSFPVLATIFIIYFGAQEVVNQNLSIGGLVGINILNARMFSPILKFSFLSLVNNQENNKVENIDKSIKENVDGVNPKIISGLLVLKDLSLGFPNSKEVLFQRLNCTIPSGGIVVINGYNSAGKTSLCKSFLGLIKPLKGSILFDNIELNKFDISWLRRQICYLPQEVELFNLSIKDNILINLSKTQLQQTNDRVLLKTISSVGLTDYINKIPDGINQIIENNGKNLPVGIKKRIGIARAIINNGKFIIFDEPSESLDNKGVFDLYKILNNFIKLKKTLIIASHDPNILKSANIVIDLSTKPIPRIGIRKKRKANA